MHTKEEFGLGTLYHATHMKNRDAILKNGIRAGSWLSYYRDEAYQTQVIDHGYTNIIIFKVDLPKNWLLEKRDSTNYGTILKIPPRYIRISR
jgi:hypothetical protein